MLEQKLLLGTSGTGTVPKQPKNMGVGESPEQPLLQGPPWMPEGPVLTGSASPSWVRHKSWQRHQEMNPPEAK